MLILILSLHFGENSALSKHFFWGAKAKKKKRASLDSLPSSLRPRLKQRVMRATTLATGPRLSHGDSTRKGRTVVSLAYYSLSSLEGPTHPRYQVRADGSLHPWPESDLEEGKLRT